MYDNGQGFDFIMKEEARDKLVRQGGIGLSNVDKRLKLQFGEAYHMEWESQPDQLYRNQTLFTPQSLMRNWIVGKDMLG